MQELFDLWRAAASDAINVFGDFAAALHHLKLGKAQGPETLYVRSW